MGRESFAFPITSLVGQSELKRALIINIVDPRVGGVLVMGERGTGKSTAVRGILDLLPEIEVVLGDPFNSSVDDLELMSEAVRTAVEKGECLPLGKKKVPFVDLPLGATEDCVCGTLDFEKAFEGSQSLTPGLLARANRGILYVDEVNLLGDNLVDVLLDASASGWNVVERDGMSFKHPARFILVGSGNPEEGELRPQILDRFGMYCEICTVKDPDARFCAVRERVAFDRNPELYVQNCAEEINALKNKIIHARSLLSKVIIDYRLALGISRVCSILDIDGIRGDIAVSRAARVVAALDGRTEVSRGDIFEVAPLVLRHRVKKDPSVSINIDEKIWEALDQVPEFEWNIN